MISSIFHHIKDRVATGQGKVSEFCKLVREILNTKEVGGKVREFHYFGPKYVL